RNLAPGDAFGSLHNGTHAEAGAVAEVECVG
ncbi:hypothetical protein EMGBD1_19880, partial [Anaerolineaceae bacterium]